MGDYTKQTENYRQKNSNTINQNSSNAVVYTCWRCNKTFELSERARPDTVRCPHCNMIHGKITSK